MRTASLLTVAASIARAVLGVPASTPLSENVLLSTGAIRGNPRDTNGLLSFKGIPFAQPPTGNLRWHRPLPPTSHTGTLNATAYASDCYSSTIPPVPHTVPPSEDCLFLNIWTGAQQATEKRAVMVWIYGGGFEFGSGSQAVYDGSNLAVQGVVVVTFNYRLGVFGFLALSDLDQEGTNSGNFGLQDSLAALTWVRQNIAAFGGDPDNITLFGESAGAHAVGLLMSSSLSQGHFDKAILESGAFWDSEAGPLETFSQARARGVAFQNKIGASSLAALRATSADSINAAAPWIVTTDPKLTAFAPNLDNYVLKQNAGTVFTDGGQLKIPLLAGWNVNEGQTFASYGIPHTTKQQFEEGAKLYFGNEVPVPFTSLYPDSTPEQLNRSAIDLVGDMVIREQTYTAADLQHRTAGLLPNSVYVYQYNYTSAFEPIPLHTAEVPYVFGNFVPNPRVFPGQGAPNSQDQAFSTSVRTYWTNFAKTGNPNGHGVPQWPAYQGAGISVQSLSNNIQSFNYDIARYTFIASFRTNGALPERWKSVNVSTVQ